MDKRIITLIIAAGLCVSASGCGSKSSSSGSVSDVSASEASATAASAEKTEASEASSAETTTAAVTKAENADLNYYDTEDGKFRIGLGKEFKEYKNEAVSDCEFSFTPDGMSVVGFMTYSGRHFSAAGFVDGLQEGFREKFENVSSDFITVNGLPVALITASQTIGGVENNFVYYTVQYGNGDLLMVIIGAPEVSSYKIQIEDIIGNVEYKGEPLKTEDELFDGGEYEMTVPEKFSVWENKLGEVRVIYNLCDSEAEYMCRLTVFEEEADSAKELFSERAKSRYENKNTISVEQDEAEFLGRDAYRIFWKIEKSPFALTTETYYFEENGKVYSLSITADSGIFDRFREECQPVIDSIKFK